MSGRTVPRRPFPFQDDTPSLTDLFPPACGRAIANAFRRMEVAEEEIRAAVARYPNKAAEIDGAFPYLCPTAVLKELGDEVFRAHCREMLERAAQGHDMDRGTTAEVLAVLSRGSEVAHLSRIGTLLYRELFWRLFPEEAAVLETSQGGPKPDEYELECMADLEEELRRRVAADRDPVE